MATLGKTSITELTLLTPLAVAQGGTGATTAAGARTNLGLGTAATYSATTSVTSGSSALVTSGAVYSALGSYVTLSGAQTITGLKTLESSSNTVGVSLKLKNNGWASGMSTAMDFYNGAIYAVPNARIETYMGTRGGMSGGTLIFYTQGAHASTNPNPNGLTERFRIGDNGTAKLSATLTASVSTWPSIITNATSGSETNIRFDVASTNKGYVGYTSSQGTFLYNTASNKYLAINDSGVAHVNGTAISLNGHTHSYLPLAGGTMTGHITFDNEQEIIQKIPRAKENGGGWACNIIATKKADDSYLYQIGVFGSNITPNYMYLGFQGHNGENNFRIYLNSVRFGSNIILHAGNYTSYTVKKDGTGATGTWGISISGNATTSTTASKLSTVSKGSATKPVYWTSGGVPAACTCSLEQDVLSTAQLTDTLPSFNPFIVSNSNQWSCSGEVRSYTVNKLTANTPIEVKCSGNSDHYMLLYNIGSSDITVTLSSTSIMLASSRTVTIEKSAAVEISMVYVDNMIILTVGQVLK